MSHRDDEDLPDHVRTNRNYWDGMADAWVRAGERAWSADSPSWGIWNLPESELGLLPGDMSGLDAIELGCGTGYVSGWMARRGARVLGVDNSERQLETARRLASEHDSSAQWLRGSAESVPRPDGSFDFALSEYGAALWCDPHAWIAEAHRLLRPNGELVFLAATPLATITLPEGQARSDACLHRDYFGLHRLDLTDDEDEPGGIEFSLPLSEWISLFVATGFDIAAYLELRAPADAQDSPFCSADWARRWPYEHAFKLRKRS